jgi:hypothetical protein
MHTKYLSGKLERRKHLEDVAHAHSTHSSWAICCPQQCYVSCGSFQMRKCLLSLSLARPRQNAEKTWENL